MRLYDYFLSINLSPEGEDITSNQEAWQLLEEKMREALRLRHRSLSTEKTYLIWLRNFKNFVNSKHPEDLNGRDLQDFLSLLAVEKKVSASTQNQALNAIVFFYRHVLNKDIDQELSAVMAREKRRLPVVLSMKEVQNIFDQMSGTTKLMARLIYGAGLRLQECLQLRIKDIDLEQGMIIVRSGKGDRDRRTILPDALKDELIKHISEIRSLFDLDRQNGIAGVWLPYALSKKYPDAGKEWGWQYVFPSERLSVDPLSGKVRRHHISDKAIQTAIGVALKKAGIIKHATPHTLRHSFATHLLMNRVNIREVQELLGHKNV